MPEEQLLELLCAADGSSSIETAAIVAAHPDDEVIGAGSRMARFRNCSIIHVTDGAPRNMRDAAALGFSTREAYAAARSEELAAALDVSGIGPVQMRRAGFVDQEASLHLPDLTRWLSAILHELQPELILTHAYEGGHPDHDATCFAVHAACSRVRHPSPAVIEFTSYHERDGEMEVGEFLPGNGSKSGTVVLTNEERERKRRMFECFATQQHVLRGFPIHVERYRVAPHYDFRQSPHPGRLFYERFDWGMTGERWRMLAGSALESLTKERES